MRLDIDPRLPVQSGEAEFLRWQISEQLRQHASQVNLLTEGSLAAVHNAMTGPQTTGTWAQGDKIRNSNPTVLGSPGSQYVIDSWICVASGTPGTWVQQRTLTGT